MMRWLPEIPDLLWRPPIDPAITTLAVAFALALALYRAPREPRVAFHALLAMRATALCLLALLLFGPSRAVPLPLADPPVCAILIDTSRSMRAPIDALANAPSRFEALHGAWLHPEFLDRLSRSAELRFIPFDAVARPVGRARLEALTADGRTTRLVGALETALAESPRRILLLSDAVDTANDNADSAAHRAIVARAGIHAPILSDPAIKPSPDIALRARPESFLIPRDEPAWVRLAIDAQGFHNQSATITIAQVSAPGATTVLATIPVSLGVERDLAVEIAPHLPSPSDAAPITPIALRATITTFDGERTHTNNSDDVFLQFTDERIRVLVLEGEPSWDTRFFLAALSEDPRMQTTIVHHLGGSPTPLRTRRITPGADSAIESTLDSAPLSESELAQFDVIVLGSSIDAFPQGVPSAITSILTATPKRAAGALLILRGDPNTTALDSVLPLRFTSAPPTRGEFFPLLTPAGARALSTIAPAIEEAPMLTGTTSITDLSPLASAWIETLDATNSVTPLLLVAPARDGRIAVNLGEGYWRWSLLPPGRAQWRAALRGFWPRIIRSLARPLDGAPDLSSRPSISLAFDRTLCEPDEAVTLVLRASGPIAGVLTPTVSVRGPNELDQLLTLAPAPTESGKWSSPFTPTESGVYTFAPTDPAALSLVRDPALLTARLNVRDTSIESRRLTPDFAAIHTLTSITHGALHPLADTDSFARILESDAIAAAPPPTGTNTEPVWPTPYVFWPLTLLLGAEWLLRRRLGFR